MTTISLTPEPQFVPEHLPTASQCRELQVIISRQILEPGSIQAYIMQIVENLKDIPAYGPRNLSTVESELFATLYQAISKDTARRSDASAAAHMAVVQIITKALRLNSEILMDETFGPVITFYPFSAQSIPGHVVSHFLGDIRKCLASNKHADSFGSLFNVGISQNTKVMCCVITSRTPETFTVPRELVHQGVSLPILLMRNWIGESATSDSPPSSWINKPACQSAKIDLSGQSIGQQGDMNNASTFGFYWGAQGALYGFTAAYCTSRAERGSMIVSLSARELTGRLQNIVNYTEFVPTPIFTNA